MIREAAQSAAADGRPFNLAGSPSHREGAEGQSHHPPCIGAYSSA